jgi:hypothetical protein
MKRLNSLKLWMPFCVMLILTGCDKKDKEDFEYKELTKALARAWEEVNANMPGTELYEITGGIILTDGTSKDGWDFSFNKTDETDGYCVRIYPGDVFGYSFGWDAMPAISDYTSGDAAHWVQVADEATPWIDKSLNYREVQVRSEDGDGDYYPQTTDHVFVFYKSDPEGEPITWVELDAEDYELLYVEPNP